MRVGPSHSTYAATDVTAASDVGGGEGRGGEEWEGKGVPQTHGSRQPEPAAATLRPRHSNPDLPAEQRLAQQAAGGGESCER